MDEPPVAEVAHNRPAELQDLRLREVLTQFVEEVIVDVLVVDHEPFGVMQRGLLRIAEVSVGPATDLGDGLLLEGLPFP